MAGAKNQLFKEKLTPYLLNLIKYCENKFGLDSLEYKALELQYIKSPLEDLINQNDRLRHYESEIVLEYEGKQLKGVERLYKRTILIEPASVCAAHCRWCLRGQYPLFALKDEEIINFAKYCGSKEVFNDLKEVLITGGDPFMVPKKLALIIKELKYFAPNIKIIRIGTRVPLQDPEKINEEIINILKTAYPLRIEIGTHINHPIELTNKSINAFQKLMEVAFKIYNQTVLLKGVNNNIDTLIELYDKIRYVGIEAHYLFHCVPIRGMMHHRTSVKKGLDLIQKLTNSGYFSGRAKPMFTLMTDIGKITLYQNTIIDKNDKNELIIQSQYTKKDFINWNPSWKILISVTEDENGFLRVQYPDGNDD